MHVAIRILGASARHLPADGADAANAMDDEAARNARVEKMRIKNPFEIILKFIISKGLFFSRPLLA
jgi:hypothetical protein